LEIFLLLLGRRSDNVRKCAIFSSIYLIVSGCFIICGCCLFVGNAGLISHASLPAAKPQFTEETKRIFLLRNFLLDFLSHRFKLSWVVHLKIQRHLDDRTEIRVLS
jgi:hypothetical protein